MKVKISSLPTQNELEEIDLSSTTRRGVECIIGRSPDSDVILDSEDVSRLHGKFFYQSGNYYFCDLGSRNGTIINGKLLEKDHSCILKDGDVIRIGDFALMLEEDIAFSQQSETVVRIINPSTFSNFQRHQSNGVPNIAAPSSESISQLEESDKSTSESVVSEINLNKIDSTENVENVEEVVNDSEESTFVQPDEQILDNSVSDSYEEVDIFRNTAVEFREEIHKANADIISSSEPEYTIVQPRDEFEKEQNQEEIASTQEQILQPEAQTHEDSSDFNQEEIASTQEQILQPEAQTHENSSDLNQEEIASTQEQTLQPEAQTHEDSSDLNQEEITSTQEQTLQPEAQTHEDSSDLNQEEITSTQEQTLQPEIENEIVKVTSSEDIDSNIPSTEEVGEKLVSEIGSTLSSELIDSKEVNQETLQETQEIPEEESSIRIAPILEEKRIVLISHETKKSELKELVTEHQEFLSYCQTVTWQTYNDYLYRQTGLSVTEDIPPATSGGYQAINSLINSEKAIAVIFLRDLTVPQPGQASEEALLRTCNIREILLGNNLPTAQAIIHYLQNKLC